MLFRSRLLLDTAAAEPFAPEQRAFVPGDQLTVAAHSLLVLHGVGRLPAPRNPGIRTEPQPSPGTWTADAR